MYKYYLDYLTAPVVVVDVVIVPVGVTAVPLNVPVKLGCVETPVATVTADIVGTEPTVFILETVVVGAADVDTLTVPETEGCKYFVVLFNVGDVCPTAVTNACPPDAVPLNVRLGLLPTPVI